MCVCPPPTQDKDLEVCSLNLKLDRLDAELQDLNSQESKDEASLAKVFVPPPRRRRRPSASL